MNESADLNLAMTLSLKDKLVAPLRQAVDQVEREFKDLERQGDRTATSLNKVAGNLDKISKSAQGTKSAASEIRRLGDDAQRAEGHISRLASASQRLRSFLGGVGGLFAGATAFSAVTADPLRQAADYDTQLRRLANTAYAGRPLAERRAGLGTLNSAVTSAVRFGGGTRDQALSALDTLLAKGGYDDPAAAMGLLPQLMKGATGSGADATQLATIAVRARQSMGVEAKDFPRLLDMAMAAGQAGGFELKDMAKWLPAQLAAAKNIGSRGLGGVAELLAANQAVAITAGSTDEAGNNLINLLAQINSPSTKKDFLAQGIDLTGSLAKARGRGMGTLDAFVGLVDVVVGKDPRFRRAKAAAAAATVADRGDATAAVADLLQGSAIGSVIQDRQAAMALAGLMNNRDYIKTVGGKIASSAGALDSAAALMTEGAGYAYDQRAFEVQKAQTDAMSSANDAVTKLAQAQTDLYQRYPGFAQVLEGAKVAVTGFTAALAAGGLVRLLGGGGALGGRAVGALAGGGGAAAGAATASTGVTGALLLTGGAAATVAATNVVANNLEQFQGLTENPMLGGMGGDYSMAAAILSAAENTSEAAKSAQRAAEAAESAAFAAAAKKMQLNLPDGRELLFSVDEIAAQEARRR